MILLNPSSKILQNKDFEAVIDSHEKFNDQSFVSPKKELSFGRDIISSIDNKYRILDSNAGSLLKKSITGDLLQYLWRGHVGKKRYEEG